VIPKWHLKRLRVETIENCLPSTEVTSSLELRSTPAVEQDGRWFVVSDRQRKHAEFARNLGPKLQAQQYFEAFSSGAPSEEELRGPPSAPIAVDPTWTLEAFPFFMEFDMAMKAPEELGVLTRYSRQHHPIRLG